MASSDTFYLDSENVQSLKERTKKRGDKSKIVNEALKKYFLPEQEIEAQNVSKLEKRENIVNEVRVRLEA